MHHRMPRSVRPHPRRWSRLLLASTLTLATAAGGALLLTQPPADAPATPSSALAATSAQTAARGLVQTPGSERAPRPATVTGRGAAETAAASTQDPVATLRQLEAAGSAPGVASRSGTAQPSAAGQRLGDGGQKRADPAAAMNCTLVVPPNPTTALGLTTPYELTMTSRRTGACHEADPDQSAFVEAAILDTDTGALSTYRPLVIDAGDRPALAPVPVQIPRHAAVAVWFGFNGDTLNLAGPGADSCVNGLPGSPFGQFAYCNAPAFFTAANAAIAAGKLTVPAIGTGKDGLPCPTTRDFSVVDQDQSDNLTTTYRIIHGRMAQDTSETHDGTPLTNGSDEGLLASAIDPALGCHPFTAPDQTNGGAQTPALALNELSAAAHQVDRMALVPSSDPMSQVDGQASVDKTNLYRSGVDQMPLPAGQTAHEYCANLLRVAPVRIYRDATFFRSAASPSAAAPDLLKFLVTRLQTTVGNLSCLPVG